MSTRDSSEGKGGLCVRLTTYHPCSAERQEIRGLNLPGPPFGHLDGLLWERPLPLPLQWDVMQSCECWRRHHKRCVTVRMCELDDFHLTGLQALNLPTYQPFCFEIEQLSLISSAIPLSDIHYYTDLSYLLIIRQCYMFRLSTSGIIM